MKSIKSILVSFVALFLSSCSAQWHMQRALELDPTIVKTKIFSLKEVHKRDTLVFIQKPILLAMPRDTARIDSVVTKDTSISFGTIIKKQGIVTLNVSMDKGRLKAFATVDSTMIYNLRDSILLKDAIVEKQNTIIKENTIVIDRYQSIIQRIKLAIKVIGYLAPILILIRVIWYIRKRLSIRKQTRKFY